MQSRLRMRAAPASRFATRCCSTSPRATTTRPIRTRASDKVARFINLLAAASIAPEAVDKRVQIDVAALTTLVNLQLRGYALIPD